MTFSVLSVYFQKLEGTSSRLAMTETLARLFKESGKGDIGKICFLLQGRVAPLYEPIEFGIADKLMIRAIAVSCNTDVRTVWEEFKKAGDLGIAAEKIKNKSYIKQTHKGLNISDVFEKLQAITKMAGAGSQDNKIIALAELFSDVDPLSARYIARIPLDKLRLGFSDMTILDALSWMLNGDKSLRMQLEDAYNVHPDISYIAEAVKARGVEGLGIVKAKVGAPILASLCQRIPTADEMIEKMGTVAVEPKYDGVRTQIHFQKNRNQNIKFRIQSFSRNLENTTGMFPEFDRIGKQINAHEVILDSEAVGLDPKTGRILPFQETTTRKRKHQIDLFSSQVPIRFYVFDILVKDGKDLLSQPLSLRRKILEETVLPGNVLELSPLIVTDNPDTLRTFHDQQLKKGLEGAVVKKWESPYEPGRRGYSWVKFKEEEGKTGKLTDTIDGVIMGYYRGEGKRSDFGIGAFLVGIRKGEDFVTVTKVGTGVSDELWRDLHLKLGKLKTIQKPKEYKDVNKSLEPDVWIRPQLIVEIAGDDLTKSSNHGAGIAIRFPRLVRIRTDKGIRDVTSTKEIDRMYLSQKNASFSK